MAFNDEGLCMGCITHEEKHTLDWEDRAHRLHKELDKYKQKAAGNYHCIIPVSGGSDSFFIVDYVRRVCGLNPLLVNYNQIYNSAMGMHNLAALRTRTGCDLITLTLDPNLVRRVMRSTVRAFGSFHWHAIAGQTVFPVQVAVRKKISLIIWGVHQGIDQVGMFSHTDEVEMSRRYRREHDLMGFESEDLLDTGCEASKKDLAPFFYPSDKDLASVTVRGIYLGNYIPWDTKVQHETSIEKYRYGAMACRNTFDTYNNVDNLHYNGAHDFIKYLKLGYSKITDHLSREIRWGRISRDDGLGILAGITMDRPDDLDMLLNFMDLPESEFMDGVNKNRDPRAWEKDESGEWRHLNKANDSGTNGTEGQLEDLARDLGFQCHIPDGMEQSPNAPQLLTRGYCQYA